MLVNRVISRNSRISAVRNYRIIMTEEGDVNKDQSVTIQEGQAKVVFRSQAEVFYNPVQEFNRDLSISVIRLFSEDYAKDQKKHEKPGDEDFNKKKRQIRILEALSASGLRSIRYAKEIPNVTEIVANDLSKNAVESIKANVEHNQVQGLVTPSHNDACMAMYSSRKWDDRFQVIDLDPYGAPSPFLDAAVQSSSDGALLCVTSTDTAVLCGNAPETCYTKYGAVSLTTKCCHEFALRVLLQCIESHANRYGRYIEPLISLSIDFYVRVFVRIRTSQAMCKRSTSKLGNVYQCNGCETFHIQPLGKLEPIGDNPNNFKYKLTSGPPVDRHCEICQNSHHMGGPIWIAPMHNPDFVERLLDKLDNEWNDGHFHTFERMKGMLSVISEELHDVPLYYANDRLCSLAKVQSPKIETFRSAILNAGYRVSFSHANKHALKTDAPVNFLWAMLRAWEAKESNIKKDRLPEGSVAHKLYNHPKTKELFEQFESKMSFELHPEANPPSRKMGLKRFQENPEKNWGPKTRAAAGNFNDDAKRIANQGKKRKRKELVSENSNCEGNCEAME